MRNIKKLIIIENIGDSKALINKGTGAGGKNTNHNGKKFENLTCNQTNLLNNDYQKQSINKTKYGYYLHKSFPNKEIFFTSQSGFRSFMKKFYNKDVYRYPDEAYIIKSPSQPTLIKILEKKNQNMEGSVETKLLAGPSLCQEYQLNLGDEFKVSYGFTVSSFLQKKFESTSKKYMTIKYILEQNHIPILYGEEDNYFTQLNEWINSDDGGN